MKKLSLLTSIAMGALLLFAAAAWAGEMSVFDDAQGLIIRAYTGAGTTSGNALFLEVRDSSGNLLDTGKVAVTGLSIYSTLNNRNIFVPPATSGPPYTSQYLLHDNNLTLSQDISLSYDTSFHTAFLFCTDNGGLMVMKYDIVSLQPLTGVCGTPSGGPFASAPSTGLCTVGTNTTPVENTSTGLWTWTCNGLNQGQPSDPCTALASVPGACGNPGGPFSTAPTSGLCTTGNSTTPVVNTSNASWTWDCVGLNGGSRAVGCSASASIPGACGTANNGTYTTLSSTSSNLCAANNVVSGFTGNGPWSWVCAGPNDGGNSPQCSASVQSTGTPDLDLTRSGNFVVGITTSGCTTNGYTCSITASFINKGNGPAGNFKVKIYISGSGFADASAQLIDTWNVAGLAAGQTLSHTFSGVFNNLSVHAYYFGVIQIDPDRQVTTETNTANNSYSWYGIYIYR